MDFSSRLFQMDQTVCVCVFYQFIGSVSGNHRLTIHHSNNLLDPCCKKRETPFRKGLLFFCAGRFWQKRWSFHVNASLLCWRFSLRSTTDGVLSSRSWTFPFLLVLDALLIEQIPWECSSTARERDDLCGVFFFTCESIVNLLIATHRLTSRSCAWEMSFCV